MAQPPAPHTRASAVFTAFRLCYRFKLLALGGALFRLSKNDLAMAKKADLLAELQFLSDKLSERSRTIAAGVIAVWWATLVGDKAPSGLSPLVLLGPAICAAVSVLLDVLQYVVAYFQNWYALNHLEQAKATEFQFNKGHPFFIIRNALFFAKQIAAIAAVCWLISLLARRLLT